jgi:hypothetical protein
MSGFMMKESTLGYVSCLKAAQMLGVAHGTVRKLPIARLEMKTEGRRSSILRFKLDDINNYIEKNTITPSDTTKTSTKKSKAKKPV